MSTDTNTRYEFRVDGHLDAHWSAWLFDLALDHHGDGTSTLTGPVADQAQLHGVLARLRDIGANLLSVQILKDDRDTVVPVLERLSWPVRTSRLTLRPACPEDAAPTWRFRRLESVSRWLTELPHSLAAYTDTFVTPDRLATTVVVELDRRVIGDLMLRVEDAWAQAEIADQARAMQAELGWVLDPQVTGRGYATEAVGELIRLCFEELHLRRVVATCLGDNEASWRLMERLGMRRELHALAESLHRSGHWLDSLGYALLAEEWKAQRPATSRPAQYAISTTVREGNSS